MKKLLFVLSALGILYSTPTEAQVIRGPGSVSVGTVEVEAPANDPLHVRCSDGTNAVDCAAGAIDTDDGDVAGAQVTGTQIGFNYAWDGLVWRRLTFGTAGSASSQVLTVQGIASMTPFLNNPGTATLWGIHNEDSAHSTGQAGVPVWAVRQDSQVDLAADGDYIPVTVDADGGLRVSIVAGAAGGGTQYAEDAIHASGNTGTLALVVRNDAGTALAADGDNIPLTVNSAGALYVAPVGTVTVSDGAGALNVICDSGCGGSGGVSAADDADFTDGTSDFTPVGGVAESASPTTVTEGDMGLFAMTLNRALKVTLFNSSGAELVADTTGTHGTTLGTITSVTGGVLMGNASTATPTDVGADGDAAALWLTRNGALNIADAGGSITVDGTVTVTDGAGALNVIVDSGTVTTVSTVTTLSQFGGNAINLGAGNAGTGTLRVLLATDQAALVGLGIYAEDAGETAGGNLAMAGSVRRDTAASSAGTTGDNATFNTDALGQLWTRFLDPCSGVAKTYIPINISTATTTELTPSLAGASNHYYVCALNLVTDAANDVALADDDTDNCASVTSGLAGGTTAASGWNFGAQGGVSMGVGTGSVMRTGGTNRVLCLVTSAATQLSGHIAVVAAP